MNLNMIRLENETEGLLLSLTKNCETLIKQTHREAEETLEFKITRPRQTFSFKPPISIEGSCLLVLTSLEVQFSIFNITEENNKFELFKDDSYDEFSFVKLKDKVAENLVFQIFHPRIYNMQYWDQILLKHIENYRQKGVRLMVIIYF